MITEISVFLPNVSGELNRTLETIAKDRLNILAFSIDQAGPYSVIRIVCTQPEKAYKALQDGAFVVEKGQIFALRMTHTPGELMRVTRALAKEHINIEYGYLTVTSDTDQAIVLLKTNDQARAAELFKNSGFQDIDTVPGDTVE